MSADRDLKYKAFISYAHADARWGKWIHRSLERFRIHSDFVGRKTENGTIPKSLRPVFRDREDFTGGHSLTDATIKALDASAALVVICSDIAAQRPAVNEEVRLFRARHPQRPVIPVIVGGSFPTNFPKALRYNLSSEGELTNEPLTILGPDLRDNHDGRDLGLAKVVSGILGLSSDDIYRREQRAQKRTARIRNGVIAGLALLAVAASTSAVIAWQNAAARQTMLVEAINITNSLVSQVVKLRDYVPGTAVEGLLQQADHGFSRLLSREADNESLNAHYAAMLLEFSRHYHVLGLATKQNDRAKRSKKIYDALVARRPNQTRYRHGLAAALTEIGNSEITLGRLKTAAGTFSAAQEVLVGAFPKRASLAKTGLTIEQLGRKDILASGFSSNVGATRSVGPAPPRAGLSDDVYRRWVPAKLEIRRGDVAFEQGAFSEALQHFSSAHRSIRMLRVRYRLGRDALQEIDYDSGVALIRIGDIYRESAKTHKSIDSYNRALTLLTSVRKQQPDNKKFQRIEAVTYARLGLAKRQSGNFEGSKSDLSRAIATYERLLSDDKQSSGWKRDLQVTLGNLGETLLAENEIVESKRIFLRSKSIAEELVKLDGGNAFWRNDLAIAHVQLGLVAMRANKSDDALERFSAARMELIGLVRSDPTNETWALELKSVNQLLETIQTAKGS